MKNNLKILTSYVFLFYPFNVLSETYLCGGKFYDKFELKTYERVEGYFIKEQNSSNISKFKILTENNNFLILTKTYNYSDIFVTIIDKNDLSFMENYLSLKDDATERPPKPLKGKCQRKN